MTYQGDVIIIGRGDHGEAGTWDAAGAVTRNFPVTAASTGGSQGLQCFGIDTSNAEFAFQYAIDSLPSTGGKLYVYGSSNTLTFQATVNVNKPNVEIYFCPAHEMRATNGMTRCFLITEDNCRFYDGRFKQGTGSMASASFAFFQFSNGATDYLCNRAGVFDCQFDMACNAAAMRFYAIQALGNSSSNGLQGLSIERCRFTTLSGSTVQTNSVTAGSPWGVIPIRTDHCEHVNIIGNSFIGDCVPGAIPVAGGGPSIWASSSRFYNIIGNTWSYVDTTAADNTKTANVYVDTSIGEGHHIAMAGNSLEANGVDVNVYLDGPNYVVITGNNFGRNANNSTAFPSGDQPSGAIKCVNGGNVTICGNSIHNTGSVAPIILDGTRNVPISGNEFGLLNTEIPVVSATNEADYTFSDSNIVHRQ